MILKERYDSFVQRAAAFHCVLLAPKIENISLPSVPSEAFSQLYDFFNDFYRLLYENSNALFIDTKEDICLETNEHKSKNQMFNKTESMVKPIISEFIDFLYKAGQTGEIIEKKYFIDKSLYEKYISKRKRDKQKFLEGLAKIGFQVGTLENRLYLSNNKYPYMFQALQIFAQRCEANLHKQGKLCFFTCDFGALDTEYAIKAEEILSRIINCDSKYSYLYDLHNYLSKNGYALDYKLESEIALVVFYTNKKIKSSPLLGIQLDVRYYEPVCVSIKFVSIPRLMPIFDTLSDEMQEAFFNEMGSCHGAECGWCKNRKGFFHPSKLIVKDKAKTVCWYAHKDFSNVNEKDLELILGYVQLQEKLAL